MGTPSIARHRVTAWSVSPTLPLAVGGGPAGHANLAGPSGECETTG